jgi:hypothetical protein
MMYKVQLIYFRSTGKFLTHAYTTIDREELSEIWEEIHELRRIGQLPGLRPKAGRDLLILVDVIDHPKRVLHLVLPPFVNEEDITPIRVATGESPPLVRVPLDEMPSGRTTTRDVVKSEPVDVEDNNADDLTPPDRPSALALRDAAKNEPATLRDVPITDAEQTEEPDEITPVDRKLPPDPNEGS